METINIEMYANIDDNERYYRFNIEIESRKEKDILEVSKRFLLANKIKVKTIKFSSIDDMRNKEHIILNG